jgi:hypothetical protein
LARLFNSAIGATRMTTPNSELRAETRDAIVRVLAKRQARQLSNDSGHGYMHTKELGAAVGLSKSEARPVLEEMAQAGLIRKSQCSNSLSWRSINPLPWEPGGEAYKEHERRRIAATQPKTLIVQAYWSEGYGRTASRDIEAYPTALRADAEARVRSENWQADYWRKDRRSMGDLHARVPSYRLVQIVEQSQ